MRRPRLRKPPLERSYSPKKLSAFIVFLFFLRPLRIVRVSALKCSLRNPDYISRCPIDGQLKDAFRADDL